MKNPMLLHNESIDLSMLDYCNEEWFASRKRDGVRTECSNDDIVGRSLKTFHNVNVKPYVQEFLDLIPEGVTLEAEFYSATHSCAQLSGIMSSNEKPIPEDTILWVFGIQHDTYSFKQRKRLLSKLFKSIEFPKYVRRVRQTVMYNEDEVCEYYAQTMKLGYEGVVMMRGCAYYKPGRLTVKQNIGFKIKPEGMDDLEIVGVTERMENTNPSQINELGQSFKRNTVDAKKGTGIAACFVCKLPNGLTVPVTITGNVEGRKKIWREKESYVGKYAVVKSMKYGTKDSLRHPRLSGIKEACEK